jgi:1,4-alpha-glucan branching enzyme
MSGSDRGVVCLVLHSHMPYVEGFGTWPFGEEWLFEAVASSYVPLLDVLDGAPVTIDLTPVLCDQLDALRGPAGERFLSFLREIRAPIHDEDAAGLEATGHPELAAELRRAAGDYTAADGTFEGCGRDLVAAFAALGGVSLWASTATHAVMPLLATDAGARLQVAAGIDAHARRFGGFGGGFWLPECAYEPGLERRLAEHGVRAFCVDQTDALGLGALEQLEPVRTAAGPVAVPIDWQTVKLIWDERTGYPADRAYRDYWGRTIHDLKPWGNAGVPYRHGDALSRAREHARDFLDRCRARLDAFAAERGRPGLVCCALDTELLGHWWYEGPAWLAAVLEEAPGRGVELATVEEGLARVEAVDRPLAPSSWGIPKDLSTWDSPEVAELCFLARGAELRTVAAATRPGARGPALERAARELLALQASDWAFLTTRRLAADYPLQRARGHARAHDAALGALPDSGAAVEPAVRNLAPQLDLSPLLSA